MNSGGGGQADSMHPPTGDEQSSADFKSNKLIRAGTLFHIIGVLLSGGALVLGGLSNPGIGFPIAVGVLSLLGVVGTPPSNAPKMVLKTIRGEYFKGGMKQGILIKTLFGIALFYRGIVSGVVGDGGIDTVGLLLGTALFSTAIGTALAAYVLSQRLHSGDQDSLESMS